MKKLKIAIIGGGPAGLSTAIYLAKNDFDIHLFDKSNWPIDKVCGEGIMPSGIDLLKEINVFDKIPLDYKHQFKGIKYEYNSLIAKGYFKNKVGFGIRRLALSKAFYETCLEYNNINLYHNHSFLDLKNNHLIIKDNSSEKELEYNDFDYIIACDGIKSKVRKCLGFNDKPLTKLIRYGGRLHFDQKPKSEFVEVYWSNHLEAYITPVGNNLVELAFIWEKDKVNFSKGSLETLLNNFPKLKKRFSGVEIKSEFKGCGPLSNKSTKIIHNNIIFVGDSGLFIDGITGEGLTLSFEQAKLLGQLLNGKSLFSKEEYIKKYKKLVFNYKLTTLLALRFTQNPKLRKIGLLGLKKIPKLFDFLLEFNMNGFSNTHSK